MLVVDQRGVIWRLNDKIDALRRRRVEDGRVELLDMVPDGRLLAGYGEGQLFVYGLDEERTLAEWRVSETKDPAIDLRLDIPKRRVYLVMRSGKLVTARLDAPDSRPVEINLLPQSSEDFAADEFVAWLDVPRRRLWHAHLRNDAKDAVLRVTALPSGAYSKTVRTVNVISDSVSARQLHAIARRKEELLLVAGDGEFASEIMIRIPIDAEKPTRTNVLFEPRTYDNGPDKISICELVERLYSSGDSGRWFAQTWTRSLPLFDAFREPGFRLANAVAIADISSDDSNRTTESVAVTYDDKRRQAFLVIEIPSRELLYRATLPIDGKPVASAISRDGMRIVVAANNSGITQIDLRAYLTEARPRRLD